MTWIKLNHVGGTTYLNVDLIYRFEKNLTLNVIVYYVTATSTTYTFSTANERDAFVAKLESVLKIIDVDQLATQILG